MNQIFRGCHCNEDDVEINFFSLPTCSVMQAQSKYRVSADWMYSRMCFQERSK